MPSKLSWMTTKRVLLVDVFGEVTVDELRALKNDSLKRIAEGESPVHRIIDTTKITSLPRNWQGVAIAMLEGKRATQEGCIILVADNKAVRFLSEPIFIVMRLEIRFVASLEEGIELLQNLDPTLKASIGAVGSGIASGGSTQLTGNDPLSLI